MFDLFIPVMAQFCVEETKAFYANPFYFFQVPVKEVNQSNADSVDDDE